MSDCGSEKYDKQGFIVLILITKTFHILVINFDKQLHSKIQ